MYYRCYESNMTYLFIDYLHFQTLFLIMVIIRGTARLGTVYISNMLRCIFYILLAKY